MTTSTIKTIDEAVRAMCARISPVGDERATLDGAAGRALAAPIVLDRASPACDVSAMDGYAVGTLDCAGRTLRVIGAVTPGREAPRFPDDDGAAIGIFTGAMVPPGAEAVIPRECVREEGDRITVNNDADLRRGMHIRRRAENGEAGRVLVESGALLGPAQCAAAASVGAADVRIRKRVRVSVLVTGDEVLSVGAQPDPWQLRDSNGPALNATLQRIPWIDVVGRHHIHDDRARLAEQCEAARRESDALIITGGVSVGDHDHVPEVVRAMGAQVIFHRLNIRPGKPVLGAVTTEGAPILGLPGNPVSVLVTARLLAMPALRARAGASGGEPTALVEVEGEERAPAALAWHPLVNVGADGRARLTPSRGSGDWVSAAHADGFIAVPAGECVRGLRPFYPWR